MEAAVLHSHHPGTHIGHSAIKGMHSLSVRWPPVTIPFIWGREDFKGAQGRRRIKLGLKEVVNVGELTQHIDIATQHTV